MHPDKDKKFLLFSALSWGNLSKGDPGVDYNEQFQWEEAGAIQEWYRAGLLRGLPYPVLSVAEHFAAEHEGFEWGAKYRAAGYTTTTLLWYEVHIIHVALPSMQTHSTKYTGTITVKLFG